MVAERCLKGRYVSNRPERIAFSRITCDARSSVRRFQDEYQQASCAGGGGVILAVVLAAGTQAFGAEPGTRQSASPVTAAATTVSQPSGAYLHTIWSISNQFGSGHAWQERQASGTSVLHLSFTGLDGEMMDETITSNQAKLVTDAGSFVLRKLTNGDMMEQVFVRPGGCEGKLGNIQSVQEVAASIEIDARGHTVAASSNADEFSAAQKAFACRTASMRSDLRSFMAGAGMPIPTLPSEGGVGVLPGQVHTDVSPGCAHALVELSIAASALAAAMAGEIPSGGLDSPAVLLAWAAYVWASEDEHSECISNGGIDQN